MYICLCSNDQIDPQLFLGDQLLLLSLQHAKRSMSRIKKKTAKTMVRPVYVHPSDDDKSVRKYPSERASRKRIRTGVWV